MAVVDLLEAVQIDIDHGKHLLAPANLGHGLAQPVGEQGPVGQPGERIEVSDMLQFTLALLELGQVGEVRHILYDLAARHRAEH